MIVEHALIVADKGFEQIAINSTQCLGYEELKDKLFSKVHT